MTTKAKEPILSILLNSVFLGLGHLYAGAKNKGILILSLVIGCSVIFYAWALHPTADLKFLAAMGSRAESMLVLMYMALFLMTILIWIDGYRSCKRYNAENNLQRKITGGKRLLLIIGIILVNMGLNLSLPVALVTRAYVIQAFKIRSGAMRPTLKENDRLWTYKFAYKDKGPERGDVAVFNYPLDPSRQFVKRVIAKGGETVEIREGDVYINDALVELPVIKNNDYYNRSTYGQIGQKVLVPEGHYYVLGDNSASSHDSRYWGFVPEKNFIGRAYKIYYPFARSGPIDK